MKKIAKAVKKFQRKHEKVMRENFAQECIDRTCIIPMPETITLDKMKHEDEQAIALAAVEVIKAVKRMKKKSRAVREALKKWEWAKMPWIQKAMARDATRVAFSIAKALAVRSPFLDLFEGKKVDYKIVNRWRPRKK